MRVIKLNVMMTILMLIWICFASTAKADGLRSYVSVSGSDNRACTRNQPCKSFDGALAKTDEGGEIIALDTGTYDPTTITKPITLASAPGADVAIRATTGNAVTINATEGVVVLRGLRLVGPGKNTDGTNGVLMTRLTFACCMSLHIENSSLSDFDRGIQMVAGVNGYLIVTDTVIRSNQVGVNFQAGGANISRASFERSRFEKNDLGLFVIAGNPVSVSNSIATANGIGLQTASGGTLEIFNSVVSKNLTGVRCDGGHIRMGYSSVTGNDFGVLVNNGTVSSMGNNMIVNNDLDISGIQNFTTFAAR